MRRAASTSMHNLQELMDPGGKDTMQARIAALEAEEAEAVDKTQRVIIVCNSLPLKMRHDPEGSAARGHSCSKISGLSCSSTNILSSRWCYERRDQAAEGGDSTA